jgi:hypothetical protein
VLVQRWGDGKREAALWTGSVRSISVPTKAFAHSFSRLAKQSQFAYRVVERSSGELLLSCHAEDL